MHAQAGLAQPGLGHHSRRGEHGEGDCHGHGQHVEKVGERRMGVGLGMDLERQVHEGQGENRQVPDAEFPREEMGVKVPDEQDGLEKHQAGEPDVSRAAEIGGQQASR